MSAQPHGPGPAPTVEQVRASLHSDRSPRNVRAHLPIADHGAFDAEYRQALRTAADELDLAPLHESVESWRRLAVLKADPDAYTRMLASAERIQQMAERDEELPTGRPWREVLQGRAAELGIDVEIRP